MKYKGLIISGKPCAGKSVLCNMLKEHYGWEIFSIGDIFRARYKIAHPTGDKTFEEYWRREVTDEENIQINVEAKELMRQKSLIVDSRFSAFYCKDLPYLRIFLNAKFDIRVDRAMKRGDKRNRGELENVLIGRGCDEVATGMKLFKADYRNPEHYNLMLDSSNLTIEQEFNQIVSAMGTI